MQFVYSGGTPQQIDWAKRGVASCNYPLDKIGVGVTFQWATTLPTSDTPHPYMVTTRNSDGTFLVSIASWADDYTNPNLQGLPNPKRDVQQFYVECVVHELGHVVSQSTFVDNGPQTTKMCSLFWTSEADSGSGLRYGTLADFDNSSIPWGNLIKEAVAEVFKCAFFTVPSALVFSNRTAWNISADSWADFLDLLAAIDVVTGVRWTAAGISSFGDGVPPVPNPWVPGGVVNNGDFVLDPPIAAHGAVGRQSATAVGTISGHAGGAPGGDSVTYQSASSASFLAQVTPNLFETASVDVEQSNGTYPYPGGGQFLKTWNVGGGVAAFTSCRSVKMGGAISVGVQGSDSSSGVEYSHYSLTLRLDLYQALDPTGDYLAVTFDVEFDGSGTPSPNNEMTVRFAYGIGGTFVSGAGTGIPLTNWTLVNTQDFVSSFGDLSLQLLYTTVPIVAPYPFHEGSIDMLPGGLRGAVIVGH